MQRDVFDYLKVKKLPNSLAVIPYFGGHSTVTHCNRATNVIYFLKTYASMQKYFSSVMPFVCTEHDYDFLRRLPGDVRPVQIECEPVYLPIYALRHIQDNEWEFSFDYIFYTEGDHILYCSDLPEIASELRDDVYVMPWRFTRISTNLSYASVKLFETCPIVKFDDKIYEVRHFTRRKKNSKYFAVGSIVRSFSGAWLANRGLFLSAKFRRSKELPIEHACFCMYEQDRKALRTSDPLDFFVDHLSGYEQVLIDHKNINIRDLPGAW